MTSQCDFATGGGFCVRIGKIVFVSFERVFNTYVPHGTVIIKKLPKPYIVSGYAFTLSLGTCDTKSITCKLEIVNSGSESYGRVIVWYPTGSPSIERIDTCFTYFLA